MRKSDVYLIIFQVWIMGAIGFEKGIMLGLAVFFLVLALVNAYRGD